VVYVRKIFVGDKFELTQISVLIYSFSHLMSCPLDRVVWIKFGIKSGSLSYLSVSV